MEKPKIWEGVLSDAEIIQIPFQIKAKMEKFVTSKIDEAFTCKALCSGKIQDAGNF